MNSAFVTREQIGLTLAGAQAVVAAATEKAREIGIDQCIAVVDRGGALLAFARMDDARSASIAIALTKALSAATRRRSTADEVGGDVMLGVRLAVAANGDITTIGGGIPIVVDGQTIGAIGVSSGTVDEDVIVAQAGIAVLAPAE